MGAHFSLGSYNFIRAPFWPWLPSPLGAAIGTHLFDLNGHMDMVHGIVSAADVLGDLSGELLSDMREVSQRKLQSALSSHQWVPKEDSSKDT